MAKNKTVINIHAKRYIQEVFEDMLQQEGFHCPDDKLLCWYRVVNQEIINSVVFCASHPNMPLIMHIGYEMAPLFTRPILIKNVNYGRNTHTRSDTFRRIFILEEGPVNNANLAPYNSDIQVYAPRHGKRGLYTLEEIVLPTFVRGMTVEDCYLVHKEFHLNMKPVFENRRFASISREYIDEAIYVDDTDVYPYCKDRVTEALKIYQQLVKLKPQEKELQDILQHWEQLKVALFDDGRKEYIEILEERKASNVHFLKKLGAIT